MKKNVRFAAVLMATMIAASSIFAGCGKDAADTITETEDAQEENIAIEDEPEQAATPEATEETRDAEWSTNGKDILLYNYGKEWYEENKNRKISMSELSDEEAELTFPNGKSTYISLWAQLYNNGRCISMDDPERKEFTFEDFAEMDHPEFESWDTYNDWCKEMSDIWEDYCASKNNN